MTPLHTRQRRQTRIQRKTHIRTKATIDRHTICPWFLWYCSSFLCSFLFLLLPSPTPPHLPPLIFVFASSSYSISFSFSCSFCHPCYRVFLLCPVSVSLSLSGIVSWPAYHFVCLCPSLFPCITLSMATPLSADLLIGWCPLQFTNLCRSTSRLSPSLPSLSLLLSPSFPLLPSIPPSFGYFDDFGVCQQSGFN